MSDDKDDLIEILEKAGYEIAFNYTPTSEQAAAASAKLTAQDQALGDLAGTLPHALMEFNPLSRQRGNAWDDRPDKLWLLTPDEFELVPDGTVLVCISGETRVKGTAEFDRDTRAGYMAWGVLDSQLPAMPRATP